VATSGKHHRITVGPNTRIDNCTVDCWRIFRENESKPEGGCPWIVGREVVCDIDDTRV
jgi:hypothetical protein